ncbi:MAG: TraX family protein [Oscillospiraceae bacterium]|nr:TraX family protein [Oscillospiraceae bacterium]
MKKWSFNSNQLKIIAIIAMFFDHVVTGFISHNTLIGLILHIPGRIAAPIMCYMIAEGYHHTSNIKKYITRLLIFAVISHLPYNLYFGFKFFQATSIIWGLALGLIALTAVKSDRLHFVVKLFVLALCCALSVTANWNYVAVLWIVVFGLFYGDFKKQMLGFCTVGVICHLIPTYINFGPSHKGYPHWYQLGIFLAIPVLALYNGERGKKSKFITWFFYIFYPVHLIMLYLIKLLIPYISNLLG